MRPLVIDDLLPLEEYADRRRELFESHRRYVDRYRRVRLGPRLTIVFENRQTLWFRVHELFRIARLAEPQLMQRELDLYNRLLPARDRLQAALLIDTSQEGKLTEQLAFWKNLEGDHLQLRIGGTQIYPASLVTARPEDRCLGAAHWLHWQLDGAGRRQLADFRQPACLAIDYAGYGHESPPLGADVRQSLIEDLDSSARD